MNRSQQEALFGLGFFVMFTAFILFLIGWKADNGAWMAGLAILCAVLAIVFLLLFLEFQGQRTAPVAAAYVDYPGDVHDVIDIEGIGPKYAKALHAAGIQSTARLCFVGAAAAAQATGAPLKTAEKWIAMAQLVKINGVGKQYAEALVRGGVLEIEQLRTSDPAVVARDVQKYLDSLDSKVLGNKVTMRRVQGWQDKAKTMKRVAQPVPEV